LFVGAGYLHCESVLHLVSVGLAEVRLAIDGVCLRACRTCTSLTKALSILTAANKQAELQCRRHASAGVLQRRCRMS
jgi:hypothetical protein